MQRSLKLDDANVDAYRQLSELFRLQAHSVDSQRQTELLARSAAAWDHAHALARPSGDSAWVYTSRGIGLGLTPGDPLRDWRAIAYLEAALLIGGDELTVGSQVVTFTQIAGAFGDVGLFACSVATARRAVALDTGDETARMQLAISLLNWGDYDEAAEALADLGSPRADLKPYLVAKSGDRGEALTLLEAVKSPDRWVREITAETRALLGDEEAARRDYAALLDIPPDGPAGELAHAGAAYHLGEYGRARELAAKLTDAPFANRTEAATIVALCDLATGTATDAEAVAQELLKLNPTPAQLRQLRLEADLLARAVTDRPAVTRFGDYLEEDPPLDQRTPETELEGVIAQFGAEPVIGWAARTTLARRQRERGSPWEAIRLYQASEPPDQYLPVPGVGERRTLAELLVAAQSRFRSGDAGCVKLFEEGLALTEMAAPRESTLRIGFEVGVAFTQVTAGDQERALQHLRNVVTGTEEPPVDPGTVVDACAALAEHPMVLLALEFEFLTLSQGEPGLEAAAEVARALSDRAVTMLDVPGTTPGIPDLRPGAEIGDGLIPDDSGPSWILFTTYVPEMRRRILEDTGVSVSGISFRRGDFEEPGKYRIDLEGVIQAQGRVPLERVFVALSAADAKHRGLAADEMQDGVDPVTGTAGVWIGPEHLEGLGIAGLDPLAYVVRHLEAVLRANVQYFLRLDDAEAMLDRWSLDPDVALTVERCLSEPRSRIRFAAVVRRLAAGRIPLGDGRAVLIALQDYIAADLDVPDLAAIARAATVGTGPGLALDRRHIELPTDLCQRVDAALASGAPRASALLGQWIDGHGEVDTNTVLVAPDSSARRRVQVLIAHRYPYLTVISADELSTTAPARVAAATGVDQPPAVSNVGAS